MAENITAGSIVKSSLVTAFTIVAALIWKDLISNIISYFAPTKQEIFYEFIAAIVATIFIVIAIYVFIKTETEAEILIEKVKKKKPKPDAQAQLNK